MWHLNKIPKVLHVYWSGEKMSYLRYLTLASFRYYNPEWEIKLYRSVSDKVFSTWNTGEQGYPITWEDWGNEVKALDVKTIDIDFDKMGFSNSYPAVHKSDYLRWYLLFKEGGVWADMDILFIKPMDSIYFNLHEFNQIDVVYCISEYGHSIGFIAGAPGTNYFKKIKDASAKEYKKNSYQGIGSILCNKVFPTPSSIRENNPYSYNLSMDMIYPYDANEVKGLFEGTKDKTTQWTIGIHWYAGKKIAGKYLNNTQGGVVRTGQYGIIDQYIAKMQNDIQRLTSPVKVSIVMAYYNRQAQLDKTIESIKRSSIKNYEIIIVDDASDVPVKCDGAKIITVNKKDKWYTCSAVAYNMGFREATGDIIIIQNPECYHAGDILSYVVKNIRPNGYLAFGCYAISKGETEAFHRGIEPTIQKYVFTSSTKNGWYNHSKYRPVAYHFCSAIMRKDLDKIGGFDERYAKGVAFDDDDFIRHISHSGLKVDIIDSPYVIHQYHTHGALDIPSNFRPLHQRNQDIFSSGYYPNIPRAYSRNTEFFRDSFPPWDLIERKYNDYFVNYDGDKTAHIPKILHCIWLGSPLPAKYTTLIDKWRFLHPTWEFKLWGDKDIEGFGMINKDIYHTLDNYGVKSTLWRYEILYRYGGVYADLDFEWLKPIDDLLYLDFFGGGRCDNASTPILAEGLMGCGRGNVLMERMIHGIKDKQDYIINNQKMSLRNIAWEYLTQMFIDYLKKTTDKVVLFPDAFFYPMPNSFRREIREHSPSTTSRIHSYIKPDTRCIHLWHTAWVSEDAQEDYTVIKTHVRKHTVLNNKRLNKADRHKRRAIIRNKKRRL